jgi:hypothetical protein
MTVADSAALKNAMRNVKFSRELIRASLKDCSSDRTLSPKSLDVLDNVMADLTGMIEREKRRQIRRKARRQRLKGEGRDS